MVFSHVYMSRILFFRLNQHLNTCDTGGFHCMVLLGPCFENVDLPPLNVLKYKLGFCLIVHGSNMHECCMLC